MKLRIALLVAALTTIALTGGCRFKSVESYESATTPTYPAPDKDKVIDKYTYGGDAMASGGLHAQTSYATSRPGSGYFATPAPAPAKPAKG